MNVLRRTASFYRLQIRILWNWRPGRVSLLKRGAISFFVAFVSLLAAAVLLPGVKADSLRTIAAAVVVLAILNMVLRPVILAIFASISIIAVALATLVFQVVAFLLITRFVPDYQVAGWFTALVASLVFAAVDTMLGAVLAIDDGDTYWGTLVQQLAARRTDVIHSSNPGVVIVQIDGLANPILQHQVRSGRVPFISHWLRSGAVKLDEWEALLPSQTSASQAGILHGNNSFIPAFRWWEKDRGALMVSNHPADAAEIVRRASNGEGLLSNDGASVGNLVSGDAARSYITMSTIQERQQGIAKSRAFYSFFASPTNYLHALVRGVGDVIKEYIQASRERRADIEPRMHRGMPYPIARAATNVLLRSLSTALVMEEMYRGTPVIYVDYTDYDELAHHSGPERAEALDALDGVDRVLRSLQRASADAPRPYRFIVLSDHGQSLGSTFMQRYNKTLEATIQDLMGGTSVAYDATGRVEEWGPINALANEASKAGGATGSVTRAAFKSRTDDGTIDLTPKKAQAETKAVGGVANDTPPELVVVASGNLGLVYFPRLPGRVDLETIRERWPALIDGLRMHPGIGIVLVRSKENGLVALGPAGSNFLDKGRIEGTDPVAQYGGHSADGLRRVDSMAGCGDIMLISFLDKATDEVAAFEELIGSHGGLGGAQTHPFILHPSDWAIDEPIVGAEAVYRQIRAWLHQAGIELGHGEPSNGKAASEAASEAVAAAAGR
jgi:uncharacterized membrane protein YvlD (DUF360 family)